MFWRAGQGFLVANGVFTIRELLVSIKMLSANPWTLKSENLSLSASRTPPPQNYILKVYPLMPFQKKLLLCDLLYKLRVQGLS